MTNCRHSFIGKADGVHCAKCGLKLTAQEYAAMAQPSAAEEKKPARAGKKVTKSE